MIKSLLVPLLFIILPSCSHFGSERVTYSIEFPKELNQVNELIVEKKTDDARMKIDDYLNKSENIHWFGHAHFLKAFSYEVDENYPESIKSYRSAIQHSSQYDSNVEAKALYNLSFVYEKSHKPDELLISLIDLMKRREYFDILTAQVEIPARLAAAYFSQEKEKEAKIFHREASQNFEDMVRRKKFKSSKEELSKSLYYLGVAVFNPINEKSEVLINKLNLGQKYFLASVEASDSSWADKAADRLQGEYEKLWEMIQNYSDKDSTLDRRAQEKQTQLRQLEMASSFYDLIHRLKVEEFPMSNVNRRSKELMDHSNRWLVKIEQFAMTLNLGPEMTRDKDIKNKKLSLYIEEKKQPVKINKELSKENEVVLPQDVKPDKKTSTILPRMIETKKIKVKKVEIQKLPLKDVESKDIGEDPNL